MFFFFLKINEIFAIARLQRSRHVCSKCLSLAAFLTASSTYLHQEIRLVSWLVGWLLHRGHIRTGNSGPSWNPSTHPSSKTPSIAAGFEKLHAGEGEEAGGPETCVASTDLQWGGVQRGELDSF